MLARFRYFALSAIRHATLQAIRHATLRVILQSSQKRFLLIVLGGALLLRLLMVAAVGIPQNEELYEQGGIAENIYKGHGFSFHAWYIYTSLQEERRAVMREAPTFLSANQPPMYPAIIAGTYFLFGQTPHARLFLVLLDCCLGMLSVWLVYQITLEARLYEMFEGIASEHILPHDEAIARLAAVMGACFLPAAHAATKILALVPSVFVALLAMWAVVRAARVWSLASSACLGVAFGFLMMTRSEAMLLFAVLVVVLLAGHISEHGFVNGASSAAILHSVRNGAIAILVCAVVIAPWTWRNYTLFHRFMPTISRAWHEIWRGNNALFEGSIYRIRGVEGEQFLSACDTLRNRHILQRLDSLPYNQAFEPKMDDIFKEESLAYMKANPVRTTAMTLLKAGEIWMFDMFYSKTRHPAYLLTVLPWTICAMTGLVALWRRRIRAGAWRAHQSLLLWCCSCIYAYYTAIFGITFYMVRYQIYFVSLLMPFVGLGAWFFLHGKEVRVK